MAIDAAVDGQALRRRTLAATDLISGGCCRLPNCVCQDLLDHLSKGHIPPVVTFRDWLVAEAAQDKRHLQKLWNPAASKRK
jgi:LysR family glycine cleavage system transcriptional activator